MIGAFGAVWIQILVLTYLIAREVRRRQKANLVVVLGALSLMGLVAFQELYVLTKIRQTSPVALFGNVLSRGGVGVSIWWVTAAICVSAIVIVLPKRPLTIQRPIEQASPLGSGAYCVVGLVVLVGLSLLVSALGGWRELFLHPGSIAPGQAFSLAVIQVGKFPAIRNAWCRRRVGRVDWMLFLTVFMIVLLNSRILAGLILLELAVAFHYGGRPIRTFAYVVGAVALVALVVGYGAIRDFRQQTSGHTWSQYLDAGFGRGQGVEEFLYGTNIEGFSGFAGAVSRHLVNPIRFDLTGSYTWENTMRHAVPAQLRKFVFRDGAQDAAVGNYDYRGSIVPGGFEQAFVQWSFPGVLIFGAALGAFGMFVDRRLRSTRARLFLVLMAPYVVVLVRGPHYALLVDGLGQLGGLAMFGLARIVGVMTTTLEAKGASGGRREVREVGDVLPDGV